MREELRAAARRAAERYGTPLYLYDTEQLRRDAGEISAAFPDPWARLYSLKANGLPPLLRELPSLGFGANAVSGGELALAARAGFPLDRTALEGIGKSDADLRRVAELAAAGTPLLWVSLESADEAAALREQVAEVRRRAGTDVRVDVLVRVNPAVRPETHQGLAVGATDSKFGVTPEELEAVVEAGGGPAGPLRWRGIHLHVGSQLGAIDAWRSALRVGLATLLLQRGGLPDFDTLDAGSGFPVLPDDMPAPSVAAFGEAARAALEEIGADAATLRLAIEPGRALVARSGWVVARVLHVRDRESRQVILDVGMTELIRPALYGAQHPMTAITSLRRPVEADATDAGRDRLPAITDPVDTVVDGPVCESTDRLGTASLPPLARGDLVAIGLAGAYGSAMSSTYNGRPRPPEVAWTDGRLRLLRRRGTEAALP